MLRELELENIRKKVLCYMKNTDKVYKNKLMAMKPPENLFKYFSLNKNTLNSLLENSMFATNPLFFNDVFDSRNHNGDIDKLEDIKESIENNRFIREHSTNMYRVVCLSEVSNSILMWSHYAESHTGICVEYNLAANESLSRWILPVKYLDKPIDVSNLYNLESKYNKEIEVAEIINLISKFNVWSYEKEWRIIFLFNINGINKYDKGILINKMIPKKIILGCKFFNSLNYLNGNEYKQRIFYIKTLFKIALDREIPISMYVENTGEFRITEIEIDRNKIFNIISSDEYHLCYLELEYYIIELIKNNFIKSKIGG